MKKQIRNRVMMLITGPQYEALVKAGYPNMKPIIKLFGGNLTWLVTGIEDGILYGYADLGMGCVEWGSLVHESELPTLKCGIGYLERDRNWTPKEGDKYLEMDTLIGV
jgi:hypothetical protein